MKKYYTVTWTVRLRALVEAESAEDAQKQVEDMDCQFDGTYCEDSFEIVNIAEAEV